MGHQPIQIENEYYKVAPKMRTGILIAVAVGLFLFALGAFIARGALAEDAGRLWGVLIQNITFFTLTALAAIFFIAAHSVGFSGWHTLVKRIPEAIGTFVPIGSIMLLVLGLLLFLDAKLDLGLGLSHMYEWTNTELLNGDPQKMHPHDSVMPYKKWWFNFPFFFGRLLMYAIIWSIFSVVLRRLSIREDNGSTINIYKRNKAMSAMFLFFFAITSSTFAWDWLMSIDVHWYSTMFGWYTFSSFFVTCLSLITLMVVFLKQTGHLKLVNDSHVHDLGKFVFAFSVFWTYLWFSQYMLIWYAHIPEETGYFKKRMKIPGFNFLFFFNLVINFATPFLVLMTRKAKRRVGILIFMCITLIIGHWLDFYLMIMPGAVGYESTGFGILEIGAFLVFGGVFLLVILSSLSKASLVPINSPYVKESVYHNI